MLRLDTLRFTALTIALALAAGCGDDGGGPDASCELGTEGCACNMGTCGSGLACDEGMCVRVESSGISIDDANARSCELIVIESELEVINVQFGSGVEGTFVREAPRTAITFHRSDDSAFGSDAVSVQTTSDPGGSLSIRRPRCFDRDGAELSGDPLSLSQ